MASANSDEASAFTDDEIAGNILIMFWPAKITANTLAWMMHLMAEHPEVQRQMQAEAHQVLCEAERPPTFLEHFGASVPGGRDIRRALVSALDDQALHFDAIMALEAARPLVRAPRSQPSIDWARARLMELVCRGLTNKEIRPRVVHQSKHH